MTQVQTENPGAIPVVARPKPSAPHVAAVACAAFLPILRIMANNPDQGLDAARLITWGVGFFAVGLGLFWAALTLEGSRTKRLRATLVVSLLLVLMYGPLAARSIQSNEPVLTIVITGILVVAAWLAARWDGVQRFFLILPFFLVVVPVIDLWTGPRAAATPSEPTVESDLPAVTGDNRPNVYWIILDGMGRQDILEVMGGEFDLGSEFSDLGFQVDEQAVSPYAWTHLSLSATLSGTYFEEDVPFNDLDGIANGILGGNAPVFSVFEDSGYRRLVLPGAGWAGMRCAPPESTCLLDTPVHLEDELVFSVTVLGPVVDLVARNASDRIKAVDPVGAIDTAFRIRAADSNSDTSYLSILHVMSPHPPYRWLGPDCSPQSVRLASRNWLPAAEYLDSVRCTGLRTLDAVQRIVQEDPEAVIVVQGDHGPRLSEEEWRTIEPTVPIETVWMGTLLAMRLPDGCNLGEGTNTVNVFRVVLACISGKGVDLLASHSWDYLSGDSLPTPVNP